MREVMAQEWSENQLFEYYQNTFKNVYGDLVAVIGNKPLEISFEIDATMSHLSVAKTNTDPEIIKGNISKAAGHVQRATLDAVKMLWLELRARSQPILKNKDLRKFCILGREHDFITKYNRAESLGIRARKQEIQSVGISPEDSVMSYYEAANEYRNLLDDIDWDRVESFKKFRWFYIFKQQFVGFILGILASILVTVWAWKYLPPQPQTADTPHPIVTTPSK